MTSGPVILVLNSGSSSLKFALFRMSSDAEPRITGGNTDGIEAALRTISDGAASGLFPMPDAVGHRLVHGGPAHQRPARVDPALLASLREAIPFAPLHLPIELQGIEAVAARYPDLPQVACFDTAFHRGLPEIARRFALPRSLYDEGIRRYGFHGLSYEYIVEKLGTALSGRAIIAHLGNGASMVALSERKPVDTTMGFTPAGGFMMGTRPGDLDPGIVLYLLEAGHSVRDVDRIVNHESGLLGVSGSTSDMRELLNRRTTDERAAMAVEMFCYQARKTIGSYVAVLGGVDTLVFTGGIGERSAPIRDRICAGLECFGIQLDREKNDEGREVISQPGTFCTVRVVPTDEELMIARHTRRLLFP